MHPVAVVDLCLPVAVALVIVMAAACEYVRFVNEDNRHHRRRQTNSIIVTHTKTVSAFLSISWPLSKDGTVCHRHWHRYRKWTVQDVPPDDDANSSRQ